MRRVHSFTRAAALVVAFSAANAARAQTPRPQDQRASRRSRTAFVQKATVAGRMEVEHEKMAASKAPNVVQAYTNRLVKVRGVVRRLR